MPRVQGAEKLDKSAYLVRGPDRLFIVTKDKSPDDIANDVGHALGHALFERYVMWRPFWLAEGAAEYVRKIGRSPDTKKISEEDGFTATDLVTIVPSSNYNDNEPGGAFRAQSYRLLRILLEEKPDLLQEYIQELRTEAEATPKIKIDTDAVDARLKSYVETLVKPPSVSPAIKSFGNVRHARNRCPLNLIFQPKILRKSADLGTTINLPCHFARFLPRHDVLKLFDLSHSFLLSVLIGFRFRLLPCSLNVVRDCGLWTQDCGLTATGTRHNVCRKPLFGLNWFNGFTGAKSGTHASSTALPCSTTRDKSNPGGTTKPMLL